jgi:sec-independent protein translocase protein TatC
MHNLLPLFAALGIGILWAFIPMALVTLRIVDHARLKSLRFYAIVINLVVAALLTTPDVLTQVIAAAALQAIYEITVLMAWYGERREKARRH